RSWGGLVPQPEISLQMGMQGVAYTHSDLGGFAGGDTLDSELYSRWMQYGVFQPIYRPHAQEEIPSEPVFWPEETKNKARKAIKLRYKLLPYIYNMAFENNQKGTPLMIPLFYEEPANKNLLTYDSAYLWGKSLLVSPIKQPGVEEQEIYFPKGQSWYDFYTNQAYKGGQKHTVDVVPDHIPVFAKGGSFIPMKAKAISESEYDLQHFDMHYYADPKVRQSEYALYNDDGKTPEAFEEEIYEIIRFKAGNKNTLTFEINHETGKAWLGNPNKSIKMFVHNIASEPEKIMLNNKKLPDSEWSWSKENNVLDFNVVLKTQSSITIHH
ncbi:MAG TPA: TIM-barrel domain-containing protein, partial [Bacteroidales bacterium]|nr:TIM-barrel domain-containing protein [Bacteroidales bacterium]